MARTAHSEPTGSVRKSCGFPAGLVEQVLADALMLPGPAPVYGITGLQGSGKSTLAKQLVAAARRRGVRALAISIDDFYLTRRERLVLGRSVHPLLATRGPPGTHDVALACQLLDALRALRPGKSVPVPRFDKLGDRRIPPSRWRRVQGVPDLVILEGWFLGVPPQPESALRRPLNRLEREEDPDGSWRRYCNDALARYAPLWQRIDRLSWLKGPGFEVVPHWRWQQERSLVGAHPARRAAAKSRAEVERFVQLFERISRHAQRHLPAIADLIVELDAVRRARIRKRRRSPSG